MMDQYQLFGGPALYDLDLLHRQTPKPNSTPLKFRHPRDCPSVDSISSVSSGFSTPINSPIYKGDARRKLKFQFDHTIPSWMADTQNTQHGHSQMYMPMTQSYSVDRFLDDDIEQMRRMVVRPNRMPPPGYVCHICYKTDHYISRCPLGAQKEETKQTPYQGPKKCYGDFMCNKCKRTWQSTNSWANEPQKCIKCIIPTLPRKQLALERALAKNLIVPKPDGSGYFPVAKNKTIQWSTEYE